MKDVLLARGVKKLVEVNGRIRPEESVLVVTDYTMVDMARLVTAAASACGAETVLCAMPPRKKDGEEPPAPVAAAMKEADVIFTPVSFSITHTAAVRSALDRGARGIMMTAYREDILTSPALVETDFERQAEVCGKLGKLFAAGKAVRLTSPLGTDLRFSIEGRHPNVLTGIPGPGKLAPVPTIEVNVVPVHASAQGTAVIDASIPYLDIGILEEPVVCTVADGYVTKIEGGRQGERLRKALLSHGDRNCYNLAEFGVGLNPEARLTGIMLEDEGVVGTIHLGIGTSYTLGGEITAPTHYDLLMWEPTIEIDGKVVQRGKELFY